MKTHLKRRELLKGAAALGAATASGYLMMPRRAHAAGEVNWMAWGGHVEAEGIAKFYDDTGIRVNHIAMNSNASTFAKLKLSGVSQYDLIEADGLWTLQYLDADMIEPIDLDSIPNVKANMYEQFKHIPDLVTSDGKMLMAPWGWNPTILVYNEDEVSEVPESYEVLLDPKYKGHVAFSDQHEFMWPIAAFLLGYEDPFKMNDSQLEKAKEILIRIKRNAPTITKGWNEQLRLFVEGTIWIGMSSPGRAYTVTANGGPKMGTNAPKEGYYGWIDGDMLVKDAANREDALKWINEIHSADYVATNFLRLQRGCANRAGVEKLVAEGHEDIVKANFMDQPEVAFNMKLIRAPEYPDKYAAAWNDVLAAT